jgi:hypothetical protein
MEKGLGTQFPASMLVLLFPFVLPKPNIATQPPAQTLPMVLSTVVKRSDSVPSPQFHLRPQMKKYWKYAHFTHFISGVEHNKA